MELPPSAERAAAQGKPTAPTTPSRPRDNISIAFTESDYATPYNDHSIPGSVPGHRVLRLGRQHQPPDILYNHLDNALIAHGDVVATSSSSDQHYVYGEPWEGNSNNPSPPGGNYILHTKNGGKRHFDEPTGRFSEQTWKTCKRPIVPPQEDERRCVPHRRARGIYNDKDLWIHPDAEEAKALREAEAVRLHERAGRALVAGPAGHTLEELSMWVKTDSSTTKKMPLVPDPTRGSVGKRHLQPQHKTTSTVASAVAPLTSPPPPRVLAEYKECPLLPTAGPGVQPARSTSAEADTVAQFHREKKMHQTMQTAKMAASSAATRAADMRAVQELPNW